MKPEQRQQKILSVLRAMMREFSVDELAALFGVSSLTMRRDLQQLFQDGAIIRTHGGCLASGRVSLETDYYKKVALNYNLKRAIGKTAARNVQPGETILINDGSTTYHLASNLVGPLTVYTNSLAMIAELSRIQGCKLNILGGGYDAELYSLTGGMTERMLEQLDFDIVFLGVDAIDESGRCMVGTLSEARLTQVMLGTGRKKILLADHTKVGARGYVAYGSLRDFDRWITTPGMPERYRAKLEKKTTIEEAQL